MALGARVRVLIVSRRTMQLAVIFLVIMIIAAIAAIAAPRARRVVQGARPGVSILGHDVGGMLADEVVSVIRASAALVEKSPKDAIYHSETGEIIAEEPGTALDIERTAAAVMSAPRGTMVNPVIIPVWPAVTGDMLRPVYGVKTDKPLVSLAMNVAWGEDYLPGILASLDQAHVKATFFLTGTWIRKFPDMARDIHLYGHEIGNHGYDHPHVDRMAETEISALIEKNHMLINEVMGVTPSLFAPPYGEVNQRIVRTASRLGYRTIMWTIDTVDWKRPPVEEIIRRVETRLKNGAIILAHPTEPTAKALPVLISRILAQGYRFVTVSELLASGQPLHDR